MNVRNIALDEESQPQKVTFEMTAQEAAFIALLIGPMTHSQMEAVAPGGGVIGSEIYAGLTGWFFNRFYEDGIHEAKRVLF